MTAVSYDSQQGRPLFSLRGLLLVLACLGAPLAGFFLLSPVQGASYLVNGAYYFLLLLCGLFVWSLVRVVGGGSFWARGTLRLSVLLLVFAACLCTWFCDLWQPKILYDEYCLLSTAGNMHLEHRASVFTNAHQIQGSVLIDQGYLDKRPFLFPFLISVLHTVTGYRVANAFLVNAALVPLFLLLLYDLCLRRWGKAVAWAAVLLAGTHPLFGQLASCGALDYLNVFCVLLLAHAATLYQEKPDSDRQSYFLLCTVLLSQCRYESVVFVLPSACILALTWWRQRCFSLGWALPWIPWLLVPWAWLYRHIAANPALWELKEGQTERFGFAYLPGNLEALLDYFGRLDFRYPNSQLVVFWALVGLCVGTLYLARRFRQILLVLRRDLDLLALALTILGLFALYLFYYWSRLNEGIATRLALPFVLLLSILAAVTVGRLWSLRRPVRCVLLGSFTLYLFLFFLPWSARNEQTRANMIGSEVGYWLSYYKKLPPARRLCVAYNPIPLVCELQAAVSMDRFNQRRREVEYHLRLGTYTELVVVELLSPSTSEGDFMPVEAFVVPEGWSHQVLDMHRVGGRLLRTSRVWLSKEYLETHPMPTWD